MRRSEVENGLRVRSVHVQVTTAVVPATRNPLFDILFTTFNVYKKRPQLLVLRFFIFFNEDQKVAVKNYAVHQSLEDPGSASQQSECNDPAPH